MIFTVSILTSFAFNHLQSVLRPWSYGFALAMSMAKQDLGAGKAFHRFHKHTSFEGGSCQVTRILEHQQLISINHPGACSE